MSNQQYRGAQIPDHRADWLRARPPAPVWTSALSCPSSGDARLLPVYAGALSATASKLVYRKSKAGEHSYAKGTRWETLTGAAYVDQDTVNIGGTNVTAVGNATHLGLPCNHLTWPAATHNYASTYCVDAHGATISAGQIYTARFALALSRALTGDEVIQAIVTNSAITATREFNVSNALLPGAFIPVVLNQALAPASTAEANFLVYSLRGTFSTPLTIYIRRRMLFDASGLDASECIPDFVDPAVDYGFGAVGVKWVGTKCGNTVAANGVIVPGDGAALPEPMGVQWQPAATMVNTYSPPNTGVPNVGELTFSAAPATVAGLPAVRATATGVNALHYVYTTFAAPFSSRASTRLVFEKNALVRPHLFLQNGSWYNLCQPNSDYTGADIANGTSHGEVATLRSLGADCYEMEFSATFAGEASPASTLRIAKNNNVEEYVGAGEYLDIAAHNIIQGAFLGTPLLASNAQTARLADDPATGLPAIGTGAFTAFVDMTVDALPAEIYPKLFSSNGSSNVGVDLYFLPTGAVWFYKDGSTPVSGTCSLSADTRAKLVLRRSASGVVSLFKDGALEVSIASTAHNSTNSPAFGSGLTGEQCDMVIHDQWLDYSALSDEDCIRVTRI